MAKPTEFQEFLSDLRRALEAAPNPRLHVLLVTCIDLRYPSLIYSTMESAEGRWFHKRYDTVALAGAGLAGVIDFPPHPKPNWSSTLLEQIAISKKLHDIGAVVVLEHRTCGAYVEFGLLRSDSTEAQEFAAHRAQIERLRAAVERDFPDLMFFAHLLEAIDHDSDDDGSHDAAEAVRRPRIVLHPLSVEP